MSRIQKVTKLIDKSMKGIEVAPWHTPLAPKRDGWNCLSLDIFPMDELRRRNQNDANLDPNQINNIEYVDIVGSATDIESLVADRNELGFYDYIISSHNFEHLPNPIKFLQGCSKVLKKGGVLSMAIPDKRGCFDYFRPHSETADFLEAYAADRQKPTNSQIFAHFSLNARYGGQNIAFLQTNDPRGVQVNKDIRHHYENWQENILNSADDYADVHCHIFTPSSFYLIMVELQFLKLIDFHVIEIEQTGGVEFYAHLRKMGDDFSVPESQFQLFRQQLLFGIQDELAFNAPYGFMARKANQELAQKAGV